MLGEGIEIQRGLRSSAYTVQLRSSVDVRSRKNLSGATSRFHSTSTECPSPETFLCHSRKQPPPPMRLLLHSAYPPKPQLHSPFYHMHHTTTDSFQRVPNLKVHPQQLACLVCKVVTFSCAVLCRLLVSSTATSLLPCTTCFNSTLQETTQKNKTITVLIDLQ